MNKVMIDILWILFLPIVGILSVITKKSVFLRYFAFVFYPFLLCIYLVSRMFSEGASFSIHWFSIQNINFDISLSLGLVEFFICVIIIVILACVQLASIRLEKTHDLRNKITQLYLNLFVAVMCISIASGNLLSFFISIESLGLISAILIGYGQSAVHQSTKAFLLSKFASLLFLCAIIMIARDVQSFDFSVVKMAFDDIQNHKDLWIPALCLLISCLCKSAQFPFSRWLMDASVANTYVSIMLHSATIVGIGIIFISKCYFIFEPIPYLKHIMVSVGLLSAIISSVSSICQIEIKKIFACSTIASVGCIFIACGIGEYSVAILYFICHAFFKSIFFLSFVYVIHVVSYEKNILKMGGVNKIIPNITDIVWISFASTIGFPFFVSFFGKASLLSALFYSERIYIALPVIITNILLILSFIRLIIVSMYGKSRMDDKTLSRVVDISGSALASPWLLLTFAVFGSFISWSMYEWAVLHFGLPGVVYSRSFVDYVFENSIEITQIVISIILAFLFKKIYKILLHQRIGEICTAILRDNILSESISMFLYTIFVKFMEGIFKIDHAINTLLNNCCSYVSISFSNKLDEAYEPTIIFGAKLLFLGIIISVIYMITWSLLYV